MRAAHSPTFTVSAEIGHVVSVSSAPIRTCHTHTHTHKHSSRHRDRDRDRERDRDRDRKTHMSWAMV